MQKFIKTITMILSIVLLSNAAFAAIAIQPQASDFQNFNSTSSSNLELKLQKESKITKRKFFQTKLKKSISFLTNYFDESKPEETAKMDGMAVAGFICGLISIFVAGIILGILAIIFSGIALSRISKSGGTRRGKGLAIAGLVLGIIGLIGAFIVLSSM